MHISLEIKQLILLIVWIYEIDLLWYSKTVTLSTTAGVMCALTYVYSWVMHTQCAPLRHCCWDWRGAFPLSFWRYIVCMCNPPFSLLQQGKHTLAATYAHPRTLIFYAYVIQQTLLEWPRYMLNWPTHNTNTLTVCGLHTHAQSRLRNMLTHTAFLPANLRPAAVRTSCDWFVLSLSMSAHILTRPRACTVSGINLPCVCRDTVWQPIVFAVV